MIKNFKEAVQDDKKAKEISLLKESNKNLSSKIEELKNVLKQQNETECPIDQIQLTKNIRQISQARLEKVRDSIKKHGQLEPVVISSDHYLMMGYCRYFSLKELGIDKIKVSIYPKTLAELKEYLPILQFEENEKRQNIDNFEISDLFFDYISLGWKQSEIASSFDKDKGNISQYLKIQNLENDLKEILLQIQFYEGKTKAKWILEGEKEAQKIIISRQNLYQIAKQKTREQQIDQFLKLFHTSLTEKELREWGFSDNKKIIPIRDKVKKDILKNFKILENNFSGEQNKKVLGEVQDLIKEIDKRLEMLS